MLQQGLEVVLLHGLEHAQLDVGQRADSQRGALASQTFDQFRIFDAAHAVVDAFHVQHVQRVDDVFGRALFACVGHQVQAQLLAARENAGEFFGWMASLAGVQPDADEEVAIRQRLLQGFQGLLFAQVAQEAHDQGRADAQFGAGALTGAVQALDHDLERHASVGVRLRIEEQLGVHDVVRFGLEEVGPGHVVKVLLFQQDRGPGVVDVEEALQVGEGIGRTQGFDAGVAQRDAVALRQGEDQFRLQRALNVHVQLGLGHSLHQGGQLVLRKSEGGLAHGDIALWRLMNQKKGVKPRMLDGNARRKGQQAVRTGQPVIA